MLEALGEMEWIRLALPVALFLVGLILGVFLENVILSRLRRVAERTGWRWGTVIADSLRRVTWVVFACAGGYAALMVAAPPEGLERFLRNVLMVVFVGALTLAAARFAGGATDRWLRRADGEIPSTSLLQNVVRILVLAVGIFIIFENLGFELSALLAGLGIGGLAVALALQDTLSNLFAGFQIILARQVRKGDYIRLASGEEGIVTDIKWRNTTVKSRVDDHEVVIPNARLSDSIVTNFDLPAKPLWVRVQVGVSYDSDLEHVERVTLEVAREVMEEAGLEDAGEPVFRFREFGDSSIDFQVRMRVEEYRQQFSVRHAFIKRLHARFNEEGINIPFPIRTLFAPKGVEVLGPAGEPVRELEPRPE